MVHYVLECGTREQRQAVMRSFYGLEIIREDWREGIVTAWVTSWTSSPYASLEDMPYSKIDPNYSLLSHVNEVIHVGLDLAARAKAEWADQIDMDVLVSALISHDVDKPLMYLRKPEGLVIAPLARVLPHGVVGAMILKDAGIPEDVFSIVATHASTAPFHGSSLEAYVLHYADFFVSDRACLRSGAAPFYQRKWSS
ncbi:HD domain-containing protein [Bradyrhizobium pachyrhizi]|uniref:HD domain-containing protein n=1 Tax=Bradyrhizobium pachyrhizi TaxID=280333 RepID=UPI003D35BB17